MKIGVLALQGAFREHRRALTRLGVESVEVRKARELSDLDGLIIPGGESTTIGKLMNEGELWEPVAQFIAAGKKVWGTCAGAIMLASEIEGSDQPRLGAMDITVARNASGRQVDSFEAGLPVPVLGDPPFPAVFIRAPYITRVGSAVSVLAGWEGHAVLARQGPVLVASFHPELTDDLRLHQYFLDLS
ncbi:MAG TPA: pyridoxal 5'-phosphate synthase glutaminase subunit PdxT [Spirochaetia bacterium]|nr:pyridoxal 5'-phosphate synthase glutaminase subunit PdxT [Spirochaetia bacterium]